MINNYTHPIIKGERYKTMLPEGAALVLEGGGTRGFYSAGVFEAFMDAGVMFPYIIGVSAGIANALSYVSGQRLRNRQIVEHYVCDRRYVGMRNFLRCGSLFGYDFIFDEIPNKHIFWDRDMYNAADIRFLTGTTDCRSGKTVWFEKSDLDYGFTPVRASCSVPIVSRIVRFRGYELLDGGVTDPIPVEKSVADGNNFHIIVLTRNAGYRARPSSNKRLARAVYRRYPALAEALNKRYEVYNRQYAYAEQLEREKKAIIIRPQKPLAVSRTTTDTKKLLALYDEGHTEGAEALQRFLKE